MSQSSTSNSSTAVSTWASAVPHWHERVASHLFRLDRLKVLVPHGHRFAEQGAVPLEALAREPLLPAGEMKAPEFNQFTVEMCRAAGFTPTVYEGTVDSVHAASALVTRGRCLYCVPPPASPRSRARSGGRSPNPSLAIPGRSCGSAADDSDHVRAVVACARSMSERLGWLVAADQATG
ncbi:LysR substrate-binding domain-containing protein [Spirillospora sp. CA-128828]|uniref:LysR substrate-binding domain-containing protein n=1 Tax=Spirillospora sp. CA-128828 TaxID=3240033 RepID=UPI003D934D7D